MNIAAISGSHVTSAGLPAPLLGSTNHWTILSCCRCRASGKKTFPSSALAFDWLFSSPLCVGYFNPP